MLVELAEAAAPAPAPAVEEISSVSLTTLEEAEEAFGFSIIGSRVPTVV